MLRNISLAKRLLLSFGLFALMLVALGGGATVVANLQNQAFQSFDEQVSKATQAALQAQVHMLNSRRYEKDIALNFSSPEKVASYKAEWENEQTQVQGRLQDLKARVLDPEKRQGVQVVLENMNAYGLGARAVIADVEGSRFATAVEVNMAFGGPKKSFHAAEVALQETLSTMEMLTAVARTRVDTLYQSIVAGVTATVVLAVALGLPLAWRVTLSLRGPINDAKAFADQVREGNLGAQLVVQGRDEAAHLGHALLSMRDALRDLVSNVRSSADSITTASAEIASGNQDLSARTEQAASNLEETAASMEQLTSTVRQSADSARQANQLAASASSIAVRGGNVVGQVVTTMEEINASSKKISDIISVIDSIAFQTNILALNAAVEAARAGEQGRGFAVVAGEVRNLAQRSAEAAKEIKGLIGSSVDRVEAGSRLVAEAGQTMSEIVGSVQRVSDIIGEITAASGEQSDGIGQVNVAVNQLDQMTQQNAALVEESAAAAESLKDQATRLAQVVQVFRLTA